ncbi:AMP-dependent synthetase [Amycolatopsis sp. WAC 04169]|nr:AMP-dependent synthetase [Amycolatopsis sp. WAC 04169]
MTPEAPALSCEGHTFSYADLADASKRAANWLASQGVRRGDRVLIISPNRPSTVIIGYASSRIGAVFVVVHEQIRGAGLDHVLKDAEPALVLTDHLDVRSACSENAIPVADTDTLESDGTPAGPGPLSIDPICLVYTSGSTGMPKAVVSTHAQVLFAAKAIQGRLRYRADDVVYVALPLSFDYGLYQVFLAALAGAHVWLGGSADIGPVLLRNLRRAGATVLPAVPSLAENLGRMLARYGGAPPLRLLTNTGAAMPAHVLRVLRDRLPGLRVQLMFGLTECKRVSIMPPDGDLARPGSSGLPLPGTEVLVLDDEGDPVPAGTVGELVIRGPHVMAGYWRRAESTSERFRRSEGLFPRLHSGDYGWLDEDGYLYFSGRRDDLYKSRGFRVSATEVEAAACRLPGIQSAAVLPPAPGRPEAVLFLVGSREPAEFLASLREEIEPYKVPRLVFRLEQLPLTANGKIDRKKLSVTLDAESQGHSAVDGDDLTGQIGGTR